MMFDKLRAWAAGLPPQRKRTLLVGGACAGIFLAILAAMSATSPEGPPSAGSSGPKQKVQTSILTGRDPQKVGIEQMNAQAKRQEALIENLQRQVQAIASQQGGGGRGGMPPVGLPYPYGSPAQPAGQEVVALPGVVQNPYGGAKTGPNGAVSSPGVAPVKAPDKLVDQVVNGDVKSGGLAPAPARGLPPPNIPGVTDNSDVYGEGVDPAALGQESGAPPPVKLRLRVLTPRDSAAAASDGEPDGGTSAQAVAPKGGSASRGNALRQTTAKEPTFYLPMGSILSGTLLTGVDAPASGSAAKKDPFPALFRVKHEAVMPNAALLDIRECFVVASAYGDLSSERVYMRAEGISCTRSDGAVLETAIDAYASGSDGKAGIRGNVVEKTGQLIGRSLLAGFVSGLGKGFQPQQSNQVALNAASGTTSSFHFPDPAFVVGGGILSGGAAAADRIATIYEDMARQIVPVVEVNAGIPIDFIMTRGATLRFKRVGDASLAQEGAVTSQVAAPSGTRNNDKSGSKFSVNLGGGTSSAAQAPIGPATTARSTRQ